MNIILMTLGPKEDVDWMLDRVGWTRFMNMKYPTYLRVTLEFLRSIKANILHGKVFDEAHITF